MPALLCRLPTQPTNPAMRRIRQLSHWLVAACCCLMVLPAAGTAQQGPAASADTAASPPLKRPFLAPALQPNPKRIWLVGGGVGAVYVASYSYLAAVWYRDAHQSQFSWFNDWPEWQQMDKIGHAYGAYQESRIMMSLLRWSGVPRRKWLLWGGLSGFIMQGPVEILDGFADKWGASWQDLAFNAAGSALAVGNELAFGEQALQLKFSWWPSPYPDEHPEVLGTGFSEQLLKDYNAQRYWLSTRLQALPGLKRWEALPPWLCFSVGYSGNGMIGGYGEDSPRAIARREYRQYFVSLDVDWTRIETRHRGLKLLFHGLNMIKLPFPTLEMNRNAVRFHPVFF